MKFFAPLVNLVLFSLSSTEAAFLGAASSSNNDESPSRALQFVCCMSTTNPRCIACDLGITVKEYCKKVEEHCKKDEHLTSQICEQIAPKCDRIIGADPNAACAAVEKRKKCKKQASGVPGAKCKWDKDTTTCTLGPVKEKKSCAVQKKKKCKKMKRCAWNKGDKTCTDKPPKSCDKFKNEKKCVKKTVGGIPCGWVWYMEACVAGFL